MDGSPYLVSRKVIVDVLMCTECGAEVRREKVSEHGGQKWSAIQEFSWVVLRISKLHVEMNMARHFIGLNLTFSCPSLHANLVSSQRLPEVCSKGLWSPQDHVCAEGCTHWAMEGDAHFTDSICQRSAELEFTTFCERLFVWMDAWGWLERCHLQPHFCYQLELFDGSSCFPHGCKKELHVCFLCEGRAENVCTRVSSKQCFQICSDWSSW